MPVYQHASYGGETVTLQNEYLRVEVHKRLTGWGWAELLSPQGKCLGVLEHLGELLLRDQEIPMRLEAETCKHTQNSEGDTLTFSVKSLIVKDKLKGTSFESWLHYPLEVHCLVGEVRLTLVPDAPRLMISCRYISKANQYARYVRGPWLKVGAGSFGHDKTDAIFPGVEWLVGEEWSSGTDWFKDPWAKRFMPHPNKVAIPLMAVSHEGVGIGMAWNPVQDATGWFNYRRQKQQPVFASPNFIDRCNQHLLGLMLPDAEVEALENQVYAEPPLELHHEQWLHFDAEIFLTQGTSLDVVADYVKRRGLPPPPEPRWSFEDALHRIADAYTTHLWHEGKGFGTAQTENSVQPKLPRFAPAYVARYASTETATRLAEKLEWVRAQPEHEKYLPLREKNLSRDALLEHGRGLLEAQQENGAFPFDPAGRHYRKDDFIVATTFLEPMGHAQDTALDITILPVLELLYLTETTDESEFADAARKALDYCLEMQRPEGGDYWETPLHSPNLLAAGHAAVAYYLGYRHFRDDRYLQKARHWLRALLPFTHLWEPDAAPALYNTKPCLCASDWYFANWVRDHVQWEVLETFALSSHYGIDWKTVDPDIDWRRYQQGVTTAALRWMLGANEKTWLPHNLPDTLELFEQGLLDTCFADTHNSVTGNYGGMAIPPDVIAINLLDLLQKEQNGSA